MLSSCLSGQTGPWCELAGFRLDGRSNWPASASSPAGPIAARRPVRRLHGLRRPEVHRLALAAALDHRRRTGEGQYIDLSQAECSKHFLAPAFLDLQVNGRPVTRRQRSPMFAPHGVFPTQGEDRWVAIACETEEQWSGFKRALSSPPWAEDEPFATLAGRFANQAALERHILLDILPHPGRNRRTAPGPRVPAYRVARSEDLHADPHIAHRGHFVTAEHSEMGPVVVENARAILSETPPAITRAGPTYGQDNDYILRELLELSDEEIIEYVAAGALE